MIILVSLINGCSIHIKGERMTKRQKKIIESYNTHDAPDVSDERLLQMVCDDCNCYASDVIDALIVEDKEKKSK